jgi:hypothetical protein
MQSVRHSPTRSPTPTGTQPDRHVARPTPATTHLEGRILELQRTAGNAAITGLFVQRHGGTDLTSHTVTEAEQKDMPSTTDAPGLLAEKNKLLKEQETRKAAAAAAMKAGQPPPAQVDLSEGEKARITEINRLLAIRLKGDEQETLTANGITDTAAQWFAKMTTTTFLGAAVTVHELLEKRLKDAEKLVPKPWDGLVSSTSTLRAPGASLHSFGLAIDINPGTNPQLVNPDDPHGTLYEPRKQSRAISEVIHRAILLVHATTAKDAAFWTRTTGADKATRVKASYDLLEKYSDALETYFTLDQGANKTKLDGLVTALAGKDKRTADEWVTQIKLDRTQIETGPGKNWYKRTSGFLDMKRVVVEALTSDAGGGLTWLGDNTIASGRDIMHFDMRGVGPIKKIVKSVHGTTTPLGGD